MTTTPPAHALTRDDVRATYDAPLLALVFDAANVHREHHAPADVQCSSLLSIKTGACPEDCSYCPQSAHHATGLETESLLDLETVIASARNAQRNGADRFCMGAAWREVEDDSDFERVIDMVREVKALGLETCVTLGMLRPHHAERLREAGLDFYNHNLDTSPEYYGEITTTRTYEDRIATLQAVRDAGISVCCGGILGMGESREDRIGLLFELARQDPPPESVPINALVPSPGTPLGTRDPLPWDEMVRAIAAARILMPASKVRLSAGRTALTEEAQALCFLAGANSIFLGDKLLTTPNPAAHEDVSLLQKLGLRITGTRRARGTA